MKKINLIIIALLFAGLNLFAQKIEITPVEFNSTDDDFASSFAQHGRVIYFTSDRNGDQKVFYVERTSDGWSNPKEISGLVNEATENGAVALTSDGQYMIFAAYEHSIKGEGKTDLYSASKVNGKWTDVQNLGPAINSDEWDSQPTLSSDGSTLYFVSNRNGGFGGTDIYVSHKSREGWTKAENAGSEINSSSDEMSPIIGSDNKTFSFASNRSGGYEGFDIYIAKFEGGSFKNIRNAGEPINTSADEYFYEGVPNSDRAYFTSNRSGGKGELDIFMAVPNPYQSDAVVLVNGTVYDSKDKTPLGCRIIVTDLKTQKKVADLRSDDETGNYYVVLLPGRVYSITAEKKGYMFYSERYETSYGDKGTEITKDIELSPSSTRLLIYFDFAKTELKDESIPELERLIEFLKDNSNVKISIEGHTDDVGTDEVNDKLSLNRANAVKKYLINAGIDEERIATVGHGKRMPLKKGNTEEIRSMNRRVEVKVIG